MFLQQTGQDHVQLGQAGSCNHRGPVGSPPTDWAQIHLQVQFECLLKGLSLIIWWTEHLDLIRICRLAGSRLSPASPFTHNPSLLIPRSSSFCLSIQISGP